MTPAVQTPAHPPALLQITADAASDAEARHTLGQPSHALVAVRLHTGAGLPYLALQDLGTDPAAHLAADAKARLLRRGTRLTVWARGAQPQTDHGHAVLRLVDVTHLVPHDIPTCSADR